MGIGVSLILIAVGAILTWAVNATVSARSGRARRRRRRCPSRSSAPGVFSAAVNIASFRPSAFSIDGEALLGVVADAEEARLFSR